MNSILAVLLMVILSSPSFALTEIDFHRTPQVPSEVREKVVKTLNERCTRAMQAAVDAFSSGVETEEDEVDQGIVDVTYHLKIIVTPWDTAAFDIIEISVKRWDGSNPTVDWVEVLSVRSSLCE
jgi:hypothetical protein